jgi:hypothetical protein
MDVDHTPLRQGTKSLSDQGPPDLEALGKLSFGRKSFARVPGDVVAFDQLGQ